MNKLFKILLIISFIIIIIWSVQHYSDPTEVELESLATTSNQPVPPEFLFKDITQQAGIDFIHENGAFGEKLLPETMGSGVAAVDIDNDGDNDLIFVNANRWPWIEKKPSTPALSIYLNDGKGDFTKTFYAGINHSFYGVGIAVADVNQDGTKDIYVTALGRNYLYLNMGNEFIEAAHTSGVSGDADAWSTGSAFFDYDNDGDLDLIYGNYVNWDKQTDLQVNYTLTGIGKAYGPPTDFSATSLKLFKNDGKGIFKDESLASGIASNSNSPHGKSLHGKSLVVQPLDVDADGALDIFVANDTTRNFLFRNLGNGKFEEQGELLGVAYDNAGHATGAMGVDVGYFGKDNEQVIAVGNFANEMTSYFVRYADENAFSELSIVSGFGPASRKSLTFGVVFADLDNDGRDELFQVNGHVENEINQVQRSQHYKQPPQLFWNCGDSCSSRFISTQTFADFPLIGRGLAHADFDGDGDLDLVITQVGARAVLFSNETIQNRKWLRVKLKQQNGNSDAIGALVTLTAPHMTKKKLVMPTRGYLSQSESILTFAIADEVDEIELGIGWPDGTISAHKVSTFKQTLIINKPANN